MGRHFTVLEKKLAELESKLTELLVSSTDNESPDRTACRRQSAFEEVNPRIEFLKALLAAEKECHHCEGRTHLAHIEERLAAVDVAIRKWVDCGVTPEVDFGELLACSCTNACFSEEGTEEDYSMREEAELFVPPMSKDVEILESEGSERDKREIGTVLEKKLAELESQLTELLVGSTDNESPDRTACRRRSAFEEVNPQIEFLKTLLAAEKVCHSCEGPAHLADIEERLATLDVTIRKWVDCSVTPEVDFGELLACSCTNACFSEEGTEEDYSMREEAELFVPPMSKDVEILESEGSERDKRESEKEEMSKDVEILESEGSERDKRESEKEERKHWGFYCRNFGFLCMAVAAVAVAVAAAAAIGRIAIKFGSVEEDVFLVPT